VLAFYFSARLPPSHSTNYTALVITPMLIAPQRKNGIFGFLCFWATLFTGHIFSSCTKGIGRTQPTKWKDAGEALGHPELKGCQMPAGPGVNVNPPQAYLQYNEVSGFIHISKRRLTLVEI
jgi:hypothetical protein